MAITTLSGLATALQRRSPPTFFSKTGPYPAALGWTSTWTMGTSPVGASYPGASLVWTIPTSSTPGAVFPFDNPSSGLSYLGRLYTRNSNSSSGNMIIYDRLAHTGAITPAASTQALTTTPLTRPDALGSNVELWFEWITGSSASPASNFTCSYTNGAGVAGQTTKPLVGQVSSAVAQMQPFCLADGDCGIRSVESFTGTGAIGGTGMLVLLRRIGLFGITTTTTDMWDAISMGMPQIYDDACIATLNSGVGGNYTALGSLAIIQG
jgi:hypothetical protein